MNTTRRFAAAIAAIVTATAGLLAGSGILAGAANAAGPFIGPLKTVTPLASTIPTNGDVNPYGVAVVPRSTGRLQQGDVLVSNFNNAATTANPGGVQGAGTTIVQVPPGGGTASLFAEINPNLPGCPGGVGLTTALVVLRNGWVIVGSLPTQNGSVSGAGCLIVLDSQGMVRETFTGHGIKGPWDMTALDGGGLTELFVTNVLNGIVGPHGIVSSAANEGTVIRLLITSGPFASPRILGSTTIGSGFGEALNNTALVIGPTGVGLGPDGTLYVADTSANRIASIPNAVLRRTDDGTGGTVTTDQDLNGPLGLAIAPNGDILTVNGGDGFIVETTPGGTQETEFLLDNQGSPQGNGALFGLAVKPGADAVYFVDDDNNNLNLFH